MAVIKNLKYRFLQIDFRRGSAATPMYVAMIMFISLIGVFFIEAANVFHSGARVQTTADLVADGACYVGDTGWGLDTDAAEEAADSLLAENMEEDATAEIDGFIDCIALDANNELADSQEEEDLNAVESTVFLDGTTLTSDEAFIKDASATTKITYSGGMRIVLTAYLHSWEAKKKGLISRQTEYVWGGGHGISSSSKAWEQYADCSGFVSGVFRYCGYDIPSWACTWNMEQMGELVGTGYGALEKANPGDIILIWWNGGGVSDHVAIYAGKYNGKYLIVDSEGGPQNYSTSVSGKGTSGGVHLTELSRGAAQIMIRRIVDYTATVAETPEVTIGNLNDNETYIYCTLKAYGYNNKAIAAMMGCWYGESQDNPYAYERIAGVSSYYTNLMKKMSKHDFVYDGLGETGHSGGWGWGIVQWTTTNWAAPYADRKAKLWDHAQSMGLNVTDIEAQVTFIIREINASYPSCRKDTFNATANSCSLDSATHIFTLAYEGIEPSNLPERQAAARYYYSQISSY